MTDIKSLANTTLIGSGRAAGETLSLRSMAAHILSIEGKSLPDTHDPAVGPISPSNLDELIEVLTAMKGKFSGELHINMTLSSN